MNITYSGSTFPVTDLSHHVNVSSERTQRVVDSLASVYLEVQPISNLSDDEYNAPVAICLKCYAYFNSHCYVDKETGLWDCIFCSHRNPRFISSTSLQEASNTENHSDHSRTLYKEWASPSVDYVEDIHYSHDNIESTIHLIALPSDALDDSLFDLVFDIISSFPLRHRVAIAVYSRSISLIRLSDLAAEKIPSADVIPGFGMQSKPFSDSIISGVYFETSQYIQSTWKKLRTLLSVLRSKPYDSATDLEEDQGICSANSMIELAIAIGALKRSFVHILSVNTRSFPISSASSGLLRSYYFLGSKAFKQGIRIDIVTSGIRGIHFDKLISLCSATGGSLVNAATFDSPELRRSTLLLVQRYLDSTNYRIINTSNDKESISATCEVRASSNISNVRMFSSTGQCHLNDRSFVVDKLHAENCCYRYNEHLDSSNSNQTDENASLIKNLSKEISTDMNKSATLILKNDNKCVSDAICIPRLCSDCSILLQIIPNYVTTIPSASVNIKTSDFIQIIFRFIRGHRKITRIVTIALDRVQSYLSHFVALNQKEYSLFLSSFLVHDYQLACNSISGEIKKVFRDECIHYIDEILICMSHLLLLFDPPGETIVIKYREIARLLYHVREGALLDGGSLHPLESYLFRFQCLQSSLKYRVRYMEADIRLIVLGLISPIIAHREQSTHEFLESLTGNDANRSSGLFHECIHRMPCDTLSLLPQCVAIIDCGDIIVIRAGDRLSSDQTFNGINVDVLLKKLANVLMELSVDRFPVPFIHIIPCGKSQSSIGDRIFLHRLSPSHKDDDNVKILLVPELLALSNQERKEFSESFQISEDYSFQRYCDRINPQLGYRPVQSIKNGQTADLRGVKPFNMERLQDQIVGNPDSI